MKNNFIVIYNDIKRNIEMYNKEKINSEKNDNKKNNHVDDKKNTKTHINNIMSDESFKKLIETHPFM